MAEPNQYKNFKPRVLTGRHAKAIFWLRPRVDARLPFHRKSCDIHQIQGSKGMSIRRDQDSSRMLLSALDGTRCLCIDPSGYVWIDKTHEHCKFLCASYMILSPCWLHAGLICCGCCIYACYLNRNLGLLHLTRPWSFKCYTKYARLE